MPVSFFMMLLDLLQRTLGFLGEMALGTEL